MKLCSSNNHYTTVSHIQEQNNEDLASNKIWRKKNEAPTISKDKNWGTHEDCGYLLAVLVSHDKTSAISFMEIGKSWKRYK